MRCAAHSNKETNLTCGRCGTPICPECLVQTPVGARCSDCAGIKKLPTYEITPLQYLKAVGTGLILAVILGIAWAILKDFINFFSLLLAAGMGYTMGELISLSVNRKRGRLLMYIAGFSIALSYMVVVYSNGRMVPDFWDLLALAIAVFIAVGRLR